MLEFAAIGHIETPFETPAGTPIQPTYAKGEPGVVVLDPAYAPALRDLDGFSYCWLIYVFDRGPGYRESVTPFRDVVSHGVLATRAPTRPNPIGMSLVAIDRVEAHRVYIRGVDMLNGTPLLDIKPYVPDFDRRDDARAGWFEKGATAREDADERFA